MDSAILRVWALVLVLLQVLPPTRVLVADREGPLGPDSCSRCSERANTWRRYRLRHTSSPLPMGTIIASTRVSLRARSNMGCKAAR